MGSEGMIQLMKQIQESMLGNDKKCKCCGKIYDYESEPKEVKESGQHICPTCWEEEEDGEDEEGDDGNYPDVDR